MNGRLVSKARWWVLATLVLIVLAAVDGRSWWPSPNQAKALENPVESRQEMVAQLQKLNEKLDRIIGLLESGKIKVVVSNAEELRGEPAKPAPAVQPGGKPDEGEGKIVIKRKGE